MSKRRIRAASKAIEKEINRKADRAFDPKWVRGLASEGYLGGYRDALQDVLLVLDKVPPCRRPEYWEPQK